MTKRRKLKHRVRALMVERGIPYTAALSELLGESARNGTDSAPSTQVIKTLTDRVHAGPTDRGTLLMREVKVDTVKLEWTEEELERFRQGAFPVDNLALVVLAEVDAERVLHIFMQLPEAWAIKWAIDGLEPRRPMTHDLYVETIRSFDSTLVATRVTHAEAGTIFAELALSSPTGERVLSARPSDAVAIALRFNAPIFVAEQLLQVRPDSR